MPGTEGRSRDWLVCDMDDGVLRRERTRAAALEWWKTLNEAPRVLERTPYGPGHYEYVVGIDAEDAATSVSIVRADVARFSGWDARQRPLYPHDESPFEAEARPCPT